VEAVKEAEFQKRITDMATRFGWRWWHVPAPMRWDPKKKVWVPAADAAGISDLILMHDDPPRLVFLELKGDGGELSNKQREFLQMAKTVAIEACYDIERIIGVVAAWPHDEPAIERMLRTKAVA
jgi:VRR-NUC domain